MSESKIIRLKTAFLTSLCQTLKKDGTREVQFYISCRFKVSNTFKYSKNEIKFAKLN